MKSHLELDVLHLWGLLQVKASILQAAGLPNVAANNLHPVSEHPFLPTQSSAVPCAYPHLQDVRQPHARPGSVANGTDIPIQALQQQAAYTIGTQTRRHQPHSPWQVERDWLHTEWCSDVQAETSRLT